MTRKIELDALMVQAIIDVANGRVGRVTTPGEWRIAAGDRAIVLELFEERAA